jgi:hypothetical protein
MQKCIECGVDKPLTEFYRHPKMASGHLGKCKDCAKRYAYEQRILNPSVRQRESARSAADPGRTNAAAKRWRENNPVARSAHNALNNALRAGKVKKLPCEICGASGRVSGHHKDYLKPLQVIWMCQRCHSRLHALFPELEGANKGVPSQPF